MNRKNYIFQGLFSDRKRLRLVVFLICALLSISISILFFVSNLTEPYIGLNLLLDEDHWSVQGIDPNGLAIHSGIKNGDIPIEINNQPADMFLEAI